MWGTDIDSVVVISPYAWNFNDDVGGWQTTHHVTREFARLVPTVYVESPPQWNVLSDQFRVHRVVSSVAGPRTLMAAPNLTVVRRRSVPFGRASAIREFDVRRNTRFVSDFVSRLGFRKTLLWHSFPYWSAPFVDAVRPTLFAYHCLDYAAREDEERELVRRADAVFCVSESIVDKHRAVNPETHLLPNGADLTLFDRGRAAAAPRPAALPADGRLIGFVGNINYHLDLELVEAVAQAFANDHVMLAGRVTPNETAPRGAQRQALERLRAMKNVHFLGFVPTPDLPAYLYTFDVCLIPFLNNSFNNECDPLKFYQYMAMGKPVVTTPVRVAERYPEACYLGGSPAEFIAQIRRACDESKDAALIETRLRVARAHGWQPIVEQAARVLQSRLPRASTRAVAGMTAGASGLARG